MLFLILFIQSKNVDLNVEAGHGFKFPFGLQVFYKSWKLVIKNKYIFINPRGITTKDQPFRTRVTFAGRHIFDDMDTGTQFYIMASVKHYKCQTQFQNPLDLF